MKGCPLYRKTVQTTVAMSDAAYCTVCLEACRSNETQLLLACGHRLHFQCFFPDFRGTRCPVCRQESVPLVPRFYSRIDDVVAHVRSGVGLSTVADYDSATLILTNSPDITLQFSDDNGTAFETKCGALRLQLTRADIPSISAMCDVAYELTQGHIKCSLCESTGDSRFFTECEHCSQYVCRGLCSRRHECPVGADEPDA